MNIYPRIAAYLAVAALLGFIFYKIYDAGAMNVRNEWEASNAKVAQAVAADNADKAARYDEADRKFNELKAVSNKQLDQLDQYGISTKQAEMELKNAYSKLSIYRDANGLLWRQNSTSNTSGGEVPTIPIGAASGGEVTDTTIARRPNALEISCARETVLYNTCIGKLEALYIQHKQPFYYEQP